MIEKVVLQEKKAIEIIAKSYGFIEAQKYFYNVLLDQGYNFHYALTYSIKIINELKESRRNNKN